VGIHLGRYFRFVYNPEPESSSQNTVTINFLHAFFEEDLVRNPEVYPDELGDTSLGSVDSDIVDTAGS
jgi:hypothetical protein